MRLPRGPGSDLIGIVWAARMTGNTGDANCPYPLFWIGQVRHHAITRSHGCRVTGIGRRTAYGCRIARGRDAVTVQQLAQVATAGQEVLLDERVQPVPRPFRHVGTET